MADDMNVVPSTDVEKQPEAPAPSTDMERTPEKPAPKPVPVLNLNEEHEIIQGAEHKIDGKVFKGTIWKQNGVIFQRDVKAKKYVVVGEYAYTPRPAQPKPNEVVHKVPKDANGNLVFIEALPHEMTTSKDGIMCRYQHGNKYSMQGKYMGKDDRKDPE